MFQKAKFQKSNRPNPFQLLISTAVAAAIIVGVAGPAMAADESVTVQLANLQKQISALNAKVVRIKSEQTAAIRKIVDETLAESRRQSAAMDQLSAGYDNGFYLKSGKDFSLVFNGLLQARYTYSHVENTIGNAGTALGSHYSGDMNGFGLPNAMLWASGTLFQHVLFKFGGNFGSTSSFNTAATGTFQLIDAWAGYSFAPWLNVRAGSMIVPFAPVKTIANNGGSEFPDFATSSLPFLPGYGLGADVYGVIGKGKFTYSVMVDNGSNSQNLVDSTSPLAGTGRDNRLGFYTREQFFGAGKPADFLDEPDLQWHKKLVWAVGVGLGYESQNSSATAFPGGQSSTKIAGLSTQSSGFLASPYTLNGNVYRATLDFRSKYRGWSLFPAVFYQQINSGADVIPGLPTTSVAQYGYYVQTGYFLLPHKLEMAARVGQLFTDGLPNEMEEYTLGLNYYLFGENAKIQSAVNYIPNEAALTNNVGSVANTQDIYGEVQFQLKF